MATKVIIHLELSLTDKQLKDEEYSKLTSQRIFHEFVDEELKPEVNVLDASLTVIPQ